MTTTIALYERFSNSGKEELEVLNVTVKRLIAKLQYITPGTRHQSDKAIAILCHNASSDDMREWAERYLCGMTDVDAATYMAQRQSQS